MWVGGVMGSAHRVLFILVHPSLAHLDLCVRACLKEGGIRERPETGKEMKETNERSRVLQKKLLARK